MGDMITNAINQHGDNEMDTRIDRKYVEGITKAWKEGRLNEKNYRYKLQCVLIALKEKNRKGDSQ